jgi:large subunit ribosomal protein L24
MSIAGNRISPFLARNCGFSELIEMHIRKGDTVEVVSGDDSGSRGTVLSVDRKNGKVVIEGVNKVYKHVRRGHPKSPQGGRLHIELAIDASNVQLICPETGKPTRVGVKINADGSKELVSKRSGASIRQLSPARK